MFFPVYIFYAIRSSFYIWMWFSETTVIVSMTICSIGVQSVEVRC